MRKADNFDASKWLVENKITFQSKLNEEEFDFTNPEQFKDFVTNYQNSLVGKKVKLNIFDTSADEDTEKQNYTGDIIVDIQKPKGGVSFGLKFIATLVDNGGYKYMAPLKGKDIVISIPTIKGMDGSFHGEKHSNEGTFKVKTLTIL